MSSETRGFPGFRVCEFLLKKEVSRVVVGGNVTA